MTNFQVNAVCGGLYVHCWSKIREMGMTTTLMFVCPLHIFNRSFMVGVFSSVGRWGGMGRTYVGLLNGWVH